MATEERKELEGLLDRAWSEYIRTRDQSCQYCGLKVEPHPHHIFGRRHNATRYDIYNGIGLCGKCHNLIAHGEPEKFIEWFKKHVGEAQFDRLQECHRQVCKFSISDLQEILAGLEELKILERELQIAKQQLGLHKI